MHDTDKACLIGQRLSTIRQTERASRTVQSFIMSQICDIQLERPSGVYYAGETVNGHIYLTLTERALIKGESRKNLSIRQRSRHESFIDPIKSKPSNQKIRKCIM